MHGPWDTHVPCADCGKDLAFCSCYKPEEVRAEPQYCGDCFWKRYNTQLVEGAHKECGVVKCPLNGVEFHEHTALSRG